MMEVRQNRRNSDTSSVSQQHSEASSVPSVLKLKGKGINSKLYHSLVFFDNYPTFKDNQDWYRDGENTPPSPPPSYR